MSDGTDSCSHAIVSSLVGPEYYVNIMSFVDKSQLEPGCSILLHNKVSLSTACALMEPLAIAYKPKTVGKQRWHATVCL